MTESVLIRQLAVLALSLLLGACAGSARIPEDSFYRLDVGAPATQLPHPVLTGGLVVQGGATAPLYRDRAMLYSEPGAAARLQRYHYEFWIDTPPQLVQRSLADHLRAAAVADRVATPDVAIDARYRLRVDIERFEHVRGADNGKAAVALRVIFTDRDNDALLVQDSLSAEIPISASDFPAVAAAFEQALADVYGRIVMRLRGLP